MTSSNYCEEWNKGLQQNQSPKNPLAMVDAVSQSSERYFIGKYFSILNVYNMQMPAWMGSEHPRMPCYSRSDFFQVTYHHIKLLEMVAA